MESSDSEAAVDAVLTEWSFCFRDLYSRTIKVRTVSAQQPQLRYDLRDELPVVEHPHRRALRYHNGHGLRSARYGGCGHVAAAEPQRQPQVVGRRVDVACRREDHPLVRYYERPVELGELLERLAHVLVFYALALVGVAVQRIEDHGPRSLEDRLGVTHDEEGSYLASLPPLAGDLHREVHHPS